MINKTGIQQFFVKCTRILLNKLGLRKQRSVVFSAPTDFHFQHLLPIIRDVLKRSELTIIVVEVADWKKHPALGAVNFISADDFHNSRWRFYDLIVATEFSSVPWWFTSGLRVSLFHGAGPKMGYLERLAGDCFDVVFSPGPFALHLKEKIIEDTAGKNTKLLPIGLPAMDKLYDKAQHARKPTVGKAVVLYAPSWHIDPSLVAMDEPFIKELASLEDYHVIIRPHPNLLMPERCGGTDWKEIMIQYAHESFEVSVEGSTYDQLHRSDAIIGDYSSVLYEYLVFDRPGFLYVSEALLRKNVYAATVDPLLTAFDSIPVPKMLSDILRSGMADTETKKVARKELMDDIFYNIGSATKKATDEIIHLARLG